MKLNWGSKFSGIRPRADTRLLPDGNASVAENVRTDRGGVRPLAGTLLVKALAKAGVKTIYRFGQGLNDAQNYWFCWTVDVDVAKGQIANDTNERTYWTGDGVPRYTTAALGTAGTDLPSSARPLGVPPPGSAPTLTASTAAANPDEGKAVAYLSTGQCAALAAGNLLRATITGVPSILTVVANDTSTIAAWIDELAGVSASVVTATSSAPAGVKVVTDVAGATQRIVLEKSTDAGSNWASLSVSSIYTTPVTNETRAYVYTFVTDLGEESAPSPAGEITLVVGQSVTLSSMETAASNSAVLSKKRVYRAQRGQYLLVAEIDAATTAYEDTVASDLLGEVCPSIDWDPPRATMFGLASGPNGMMAAADGYDALFCEPYRPHAWPEKYSRALDYPIVGIGQFGQTFVYLTTGFPFLLDGVNPANLSQQPAKFYQPCVSKRSIVSIGSDVIWASPDGLCSIGFGGQRILTEGLFTPEQWRALVPSSIMGSWHQGYYVGFYDTGTGVKGFMLDPVAQEWIDLPTVSATAAYRDTVTDALYVCVDDAVHKWRAGADMAYTWKSGDAVTPMMDFVVARVTGDYPVTFTLYKDGVAKQTKIVASDEPFKIPPGLARKWSVAVSGAVPVLGIVLATSEEEA